MKNNLNDKPWTILGILAKIEEKFWLVVAILIYILGQTWLYVLSSIERWELAYSIWKNRREFERLAIKEDYSMVVLPRDRVEVVANKKVIVGEKIEVISVRIRYQLVLTPIGYKMLKHDALVRWSDGSISSTEKILLSKPNNVHSLKFKLIWNKNLLIYEKSSVSISKCQIDLTNFTITLS